MSVAHCDLGGRALWIKTSILHVLSYISVVEGMLGVKGQHFSQETCDYCPIGFEAIN